jgi:hypothetical protein
MPLKILKAIVGADKTSRPEVTDKGGNQKRAVAVSVHDVATFVRSWCRNQILIG